MREFIGVVVPLTLWGCPLLALAGLGCLALCRGPRRRYLAWAVGVFCAALALFFGGEILLGLFRLTWRGSVACLLCWVLLLSGWAGIILTLMCILPQEWREAAPVLRVGIKAAVSFFAGLILLMSLMLGPLLALTLGSGERTVEYQGQTLVEVEEGFMDSWYCYYPYHGPLVRGIERLYEGSTHIWGDFDLK